MSTITSITTQLVPIPLPSPIRPSGGTLVFGRLDNVVVHVDTADGVRGSSYVWLPSGGTGPTIERPAPACVVEEMVHSFGAGVVGKSVYDHERVWQMMLDRSVHVGRGVVSLAHSAIDMAMWDAVCKIVGQPLFRLLGAHKERVEFYSNQLLDVWDDPIPTLVAEAERLVSLGFTSLKMPGGLHPTERYDKDVSRAEAVHEVVGPDVTLMLDVGARWTPEQLVRLAPRINALNLRWLEDPVSLDQPELMARSRRTIDAPIATGENSFDIRQLRSLVERGATDIVIFEPMRIGGVTGAVKLAAVCEAFDVPMAPHTYPELSAQLMAAKPAGLVCEYLRWWRPMLSDPIEVVEGWAAPSPRPGIGIHLDEEFLAQYASRTT